jgi:hypothetical protein
MADYADVTAVSLPMTLSGMMMQINHQNLHLMMLMTIPQPLIFHFKMQQPLLKGMVRSCRRLFCREINLSINN